MQKIIITSFAIVFALSPLFGVSFALADTAYADSVQLFSQGLKKNGSPVEAGRSDPSEALGIEDGSFVTLGYGGELVVAFDDFVGGTLSISIFETTGGSYPEETADVYVSQNGTDFDFIGTANNLADQPNNVPHESVFDLRDFCIKYVKIIDTTDPSLHIDTSDAFDIDAVKADFSEHCNPPKECDNCKAGNDVVINHNSATVRNNVVVNANTGGNYADGSYGGNGGNGGDIRSRGKGEVEDSKTGSGGDGGPASNGGTIITGNATASLNLQNEVNLSRTKIDRCVCDLDSCCDEGDVVVINRNHARVINNAAVNANTGDNSANGSYGGDGGRGGNIGNGHDGEVEDSSTGSGASGASGSAGGLVQTGQSTSRTSVVNIINRVITRISR